VEFVAQSPCPIKTRTTPPVTLTEN
jgi:hypothetical protein